MGRPRLDAFEIMSHLTNLVTFTVVIINDNSIPTSHPQAESKRTPIKITALHLSCMKNLTLDVESDSIAMVASRLATTDCPNLIRLRLSSSRSSHISKLTTSTQEQPSWLRMLHACQSRLVCLYLNVNLRADSKSMTGIQMTALRYLKLRMYDATTVGNILRSSPGLQHVKLLRYDHPSGQEISNLKRDQQALYDSCIDAALAWLPTTCTHITIHSSVGNNMFPELARLFYRLPYLESFTVIKHFGNGHGDDDDNEDNDYSDSQDIQHDMFEYMVAHKLLANIHSPWLDYARIWVRKNRAKRAREKKIKAAFTAVLR